MSIATTRTASSHAGAAPGQPVRGVVRSPALSLAEHALLPGQVVETGVPPVGELHVLPGGPADAPAGPAPAVLVDPRVRHRRGRRAQHPVSPRGERVVDRRPRQPGVPGRLRRGDPPLRDLAGGLLPQPGGDPAPRRHLRQPLGERLPLAVLVRALPPPLDPPQVNRVAGPRAHPAAGSAPSRAAGPRAPRSPGTPQPRASP